MWLIKALLSFVFLLSIIFTIPLSFDVGGKTCGLVFSLSLATFYFFYSSLRLITPSESRFRYTLIAFISWSQWIIIPALMIWSLNKFSIDSDSNSSWAAAAFDPRESGNETWKEKLFERDGLLEIVTIGFWDKFLHWSTPVFQLAEGFCSLLAIQAAGQITRWLVNRDGGDSWMIGLLVASASIISSSVYFLWRITTFPQLDNVDAILIGAAITCAIFLGAWGIGSGRGNPIESSLLFAYITLCVYQIFTDYKPSVPAETPSPSQPDFPPLPPIIMASYSTLMHILSTLPSTFSSTFNFIIAAIMTITPSVLISLAYRVFVMYASARIIPAVRESGARALSQEPSLEDSNGASQLFGFLSWFSPSILVSVYTSLLMQHFSSTNGDGNGSEWWTTQGEITGKVWRWLNLAITMALYAVELYLGRDDDNGHLTSHWKTD